MSLEAILTAIQTSGEAEIAQLRSETALRVQQILAEAERVAAAKREAARRAAVFPAAGERARRLHHAKLEALQAQGEARDHLVELALAEAQTQLVHLRSDSKYPLILRRLTEEAIHVLGDERAEDGTRCRLEADPRDAVLLRQILDDLGFDLAITPSLECGGGLVVRSDDGRIIVINTLEARLERALPYLRRELAAFFEKESKVPSAVLD